METMTKTAARFWLKLVRESMLKVRRDMLQHARVYPLPLVPPQAAIERASDLRDTFRRLCEAEEVIAPVAS